MGDDAVESTTSASDHTSSPPTPWSGGPTYFIVVAPSCCCELDCVLYHRARDLSVGYDLGFPPLLRAGPCERWARSRCFGRVLKRTNERRRNRQSRSRAEIPKQKKLVCVWTRRDGHLQERDDAGALACEVGVEQRRPALRVHHVHARPQLHQLRDALAVTLRP
jgi:hypothetical protein